ncbi:hypothetical protein CF386_10175 [Paraphotobacterium marinum]|uniref:Putative auto-transporter adhesin head GIN domain-containing protein n=1 Tax=Paraphotobacterium marinum TaxID=1755811 RepID=A0A220VGB9_9GAMM|nr:DUF2807 domain-containing protein [Paraphotobacterium marinum]ASK79417.1 hypothetical protein CF386_10175 [Paraphotobacterium marinum]
MKNILRNKVKCFVVFILLYSIFLCQASADNITVHKNISDFSKLSLNCNGTVYLKLGKKDSIKVVLDKKVLSKFNLKINKTSTTLNLGIEDKDNSTLHWLENSIKSKNNDLSKKIKFYITMKSINGLETHNSGEIFVQSPIETSNLILKLSNNSSINLPTVMNHQIADFNIANDAVLNIGNLHSKSLNLKVDNNGKVNVGDLSSDQVKSFLSNAGQLKVNTLNSKTVFTSIHNKSQIFIMNGNINYQKVIATNAGVLKSENVRTNFADVKITNAAKIFMHILKNIKLEVQNDGHLYLIGKPKLNIIQLPNNDAVVRLS